LEGNNVSKFKDDLNWSEDIWPLCC
jgi:hypothetical protein